MRNCSPTKGEAWRIAVSIFEAILMSAIGGKADIGLSRFNVRF
jgi:hypothetical protein